MKKIFVIVLAIFLLNCAGLPVSAGGFKVYTPNAYKELSKLNSPPRRISVNGEAVQLLVDYSGSMGRWINVAIDTLKVILPKIAQSSAVSLRVFGDNPPQGDSYRHACEATRQVASLSKRNQAEILNGLGETKIGGVTPIELALRQTVEKDFDNVRVFDRNTTFKKKKIVLVTDGGENCGGDPCAYIRKLMRTRDDIQIDVVQLGNDNKLACLAEATGGTFHKIDGSRQKFESAFELAFEVPKGTVANERYKEESSYRQKTPKYNNSKPLADKYKYVKF